MANITAAIKQYLAITGCYWLFTITDGALRMLVVLHFHQLGYSPLEIAFMFLFYEAFGVVTNLVGGYLGARLGLNRTMNLGMLLQIVALGMLLVPPEWLTVVWVMTAQALSGIAKDLNKMSAKSAIKFLVPNDAQSSLFKWVSILTGSKNTLKGVGFFLGAVLLSLWGFQPAIAVLLGMIVLALIVSVVMLSADFGKSKNKPKFTQVFSRSKAINRLSAARLFLFASRDVWFVVGLPVYFATELSFSHWQTGAFMALWIIAYGIVQTLAPALFKAGSKAGTQPDGMTVVLWSAALVAVTVTITAGVILQWPANLSLIPGLFVFGAVFAMNSSIHSYLIVSLAERDSTSVDVGFYYMANAAGRLTGTLLSGLLYVTWGLAACLIGSCVMVLLATVLSLLLPRREVDLVGGAGL